MKSTIAVRHVGFEHLGLLGPLLEQRGHALVSKEAGVDALSAGDADGADLLVVLGGPIGAYELGEYPFLKDEIALIERRLAQGRPMLGVCLGCQLIAKALGARVYPGDRKVIGWAPLELTEDGRRSCLAPLEDGDHPVLHWHGDTFDLPKDATRLAGSPFYENEAFAIGTTLALQFHLEVDIGEIDRWLIGHAAEIAGTPGVSVKELRGETRRFGPALAPVAEQIFTDWLDDVGL